VTATATSSSRRDRASGRAAALTYRPSAQISGVTAIVKADDGREDFLMGIGVEVVGAEDLQHVADDFANGFLILDDQDDRTFGRTHDAKIVRQCERAGGYVSRDETIRAAPVQRRSCNVSLPGARSERRTVA